MGNVCGSKSSASPPSITITAPPNSEPSTTSSSSSSSTTTHIINTSPSSPISPLSPSDILSPLPSHPTSTSSSSLSLPVHSLLSSLSSDKTIELDISRHVSSTRGRSGAVSLSTDNPYPPPPSSTTRSTDTHPSHLPAVGAVEIEVFITDDVPSAHWESKAYKIDEEGDPSFPPPHRPLIPSRGHRLKSGPPAPRPGMLQSLRLNKYGQITLTRSQATMLASQKIIIFNEYGKFKEVMEDGKEKEKKENGGNSPTENNNINSSSNNNANPNTTPNKEEKDSTPTTPSTPPKTPTKSSSFFRLPKLHATLKLSKEGTLKFDEVVDQSMTVGNAKENQKEKGGKASLGMNKNGNNNNKPNDETKPSSASPPLIQLSSISPILLTSASPSTSPSSPPSPCLILRCSLSFPTSTGLEIHFHGLKPPSLILTQCWLSIEGEAFWEALQTDQPWAVKVAIKLGRKQMPMKLCHKKLLPTDFIEGKDTFHAVIRIGTDGKGIYKQLSKERIIGAIKRIQRNGNPTFQIEGLYVNLGNTQNNNQNQNGGGAGGMGVPKTINEDEGKEEDDQIGEMKSNGKGGGKHSQKPPPRAYSISATSPSISLSGPSSRLSHDDPHHHRTPSHLSSADELKLAQSLFKFDIKAERLMEAVEREIVINEGRKEEKGVGSPKGKGKGKEKDKEEKDKKKGRFW